MTEMPPPSAPPPGPPPQPQPQQPGWTQPAYAGQPQWGQQQWGAPPFTPPKKTNGLAIASLICGLGWVVAWPFAFFTGIAAVITGHIARKQIRERGDDGAGLALAGVILGYISIVISILAAIGLSILIFAVIPTVIEDEVHDDARDFGNAVVAVAVNEGGSPRDAQRIRDVYLREAAANSALGYQGYYGCCEDDVIRLPDGTPIPIATTADFQRNGWRLEFEQTFIGDKVSCLTIPATTRSGAVDVTKGRCSG